MPRNIKVHGLTLLILWSTSVLGSTLNKQVLNVVDVNPDPTVFEAELSAVEIPVEIDDQTVSALIYRDDNNNTGAYEGIPDGIPVPQIMVDVGDEVVVTFHNRLAADCSAMVCRSSIHWHGIELDNNSDGTGVTQNAVLPGESYVYRFIAPRPGIFWFHPHMLPGPQTFAGMYGAFIVRDPAESALQSAGKIPGNDSTHTVVLSDIEFDSPAGNVGFLIDGVAHPWAELKAACGDPSDLAAQQQGCQAVQDGLYPLLNGFYTGSRPVAPVLIARRGEGVRLRILNTSTNRYFRLSVEGNGDDNNLYRIGGEGGFLERVRLEGGVHDSWDTQFDRGEIVVPASGRTDVVLVPNVEPGNVVTIFGKEYARGGPAGEGNPASKPAGDILYIAVTDDPGPDFEIASGDPILGSGAIEDLKAIDDTELNSLLPPPQKPDGSGPEPGTTDPSIKLRVKGTGRMAIDETSGKFDDSGDDYRMVAHQGASRYAKTRDLLELTVVNCNNAQDCMGPGTASQHHPFHLHGFSFQPVRVKDNATDEVLYEYDYSEFRDVIDVFPGQSLVFRTRLEDRPIITDTRQEPEAPEPDLRFPGGGAQGRWVYHCHLFLHAALGMISELVVVPTPVAVCMDTTVDTDPGLCSAGEADIDDGSFTVNAEPFSLSQDPSGPYPLGDNLVSLFATGEDGMVGSCSATVTVADNELPTISAPDDVVDECDSPGGSSVVDLGTPTTDDNCGQNSTTNFAPSFFPLGATVVKWHTSDGNGNSAEDSHTVTVVDTKKPSLTVPADIGPVECTSASGEAIDIGMAGAADVCDVDVTITNDAPLLFPLGTTTVHWTARDDSLNAASGSQAVTVADSGAPDISCNSPAKIAPSNVVWSFTATASDTCDDDVVPEAFEYDCYSFTKKGMRVDRTDQCEVAFHGDVVDIIDSGGVGNFLEIKLVAVDDSGNSTTRTCTVEVVRKKDL